MSTKEIAHTLKIGFNTVHDYLRTLRIKLYARSMAELVTRAKDQHIDRIIG